jgi:AAT family amino acid transporter
LIPNTKPSSIVGVSNQLSWICIGIASLRFRGAIRKQGLEYLLPFKNWTYPVGPAIAIGLNTVIVLVQGWDCFSPHFKPVDFVSYYVEIPIMIVMFLGWKLVKRTRFVRSMQMDLVTDRFDLNPASMLVSDSDAPDGDAHAEGEMELTHSRQGILASIEKNGVFRKAKRVGMWLFL